MPQHPRHRAAGFQRRPASLTLVAVAALTSGAVHAADRVRIGYWSSGVSLGYGSVLEATDFLKQQGLDVQFVRFPDVNAPLRALASNSIDLAFGAPAAGVFSSAAEGVPIDVITARFSVLHPHAQSCIRVLLRQRIRKSTPDRKYILSAVSHTHIVLINRVSCDRQL